MKQLQHIIRTTKWCFFAIIITCISGISANAVNPILPLWEYIPDGEPYIFEDPDNPGKKRIYLYGSHDSMVSEYCGRELVVWSASIDDLNQWRYDGIIFQSLTDAHGNPLNKEGKGDVLYAPDVVEVTETDGKKAYYLYPNNQAWGRNGMIAKAYRPDGPFIVCNWHHESPQKCHGILGFDPAVFVDDDGKVYGYWGFEKSWGAELDPETMATVKPGTKVVENMIPNRNEKGIFRFFEASSIRKIENKYVFIYSRWTDHGEFGLPGTNYTLAYAYADAPLGPYTYGGTIIDGRGRRSDVDTEKTMVTATPGGNTHGSIIEINGQWWVFYHRQTGRDEYSRQAMVAPINVRIENDKVIISEGEYTSEGFETEGLNPFKRYSAGIACHYTGPTPAIHDWPQKEFSGSYVSPYRPDGHSVTDPYDLSVNTNHVVNNTAGSIVGYKYFNLDHTYGISELQLHITLLPKGIEGEIKIWMGDPQKEGIKIGSVTLHPEMPQEKVTLHTPLTGVAGMQGKHPLFFTIHSSTPNASICELIDFVIKKS